MESGKTKFEMDECVESDLRTMEVKSWRNIAKEREEWWRNVREARALHGPWSYR
jgi:hypothetical protein